MKLSNTESKEHISLLMDNECPTAHESQEAIGFILSDEENQQSWQEYHLIRDHLQNISPDKAFLSQQSILAKIHQEPPLKEEESHRLLPANNSIYKGIVGIVAIALISIGTSQLWSSTGDISTVDNSPSPLTFSLADNSGTDNLSTAMLDNPYLQLHQQAVNAQSGFINVAHQVKD